MPSTTTVREHPVIFSGPMTCALLSGAKTMTRRPVKLGTSFGKSETPGYDWTFRGTRRGGRTGGGSGCWQDLSHRQVLDLCPYGKPGSILWVRESFRREIDDDGNTFTRYRADDADANEWRYKPSIHLPRWASRLTLEITEVRVERVSQISEADALAEGIPADPGDRSLVYIPTRPTYPPKPFPYSRNTPVVPTAVQAFAALWDGINGKKEGCKFTDAPWVWVISFRVVPNA